MIRVNEAQFFKLADQRTGPILESIIYRSMPDPILMRDQPAILDPYCEAKTHNQPQHTGCGCEQDETEPETEPKPTMPTQRTRCVLPLVRTSEGIRMGTHRVHIHRDQTAVQLTYAFHVGKKLRRRNLVYYRYTILATPVVSHTPDDEITVTEWRLPKLDTIRLPIPREQIIEIQDIPEIPEEALFEKPKSSRWKAIPMVAILIPLVLCVHTSFLPTQIEQQPTLALLLETAGTFGLVGLGILAVAEWTRK